jgi:hypothetical protein
VVVVVIVVVVVVVVVVAAAAPARRKASLASFDVMLVLVLYRCFVVVLERVRFVTKISGKTPKKQRDTPRSAAL